MRSMGPKLLGVAILLSDNLDIVFFVFALACRFENLAGLGVGDEECLMCALTRRAGKQAQEKDVL